MTAYRHIVIITWAYSHFYGGHKTQSTKYIDGELDRVEEFPRKYDPPRRRLSPRKHAKPVFNKNKSYSHVGD